MKIATFTKMAVMAGIVAAAFCGQPQMAHAEESSTRGGSGGVISDSAVGDLAPVPSTSATADDVFIDGRIITGDPYAPAATDDDVIVDGRIITGDPYAPAATDDDVIVDGRIITAEGYAPEADPTAGTRTDSEWKYVPIRRTVDEEPAPVIDEMTGNSEETEVVRIPITIKHGV